MESNREEASHCIRRAKNCIEFNDYRRAEMYILKAERLYPSTEGQAILKHITDSKSQHGQDDENASRREGVEVANKDQLDLIERIKSSKNFYEILGLSKEATDAEIKKSYKQLALQLHPDKNKCPGASDAFKSLGVAVDALMDPEKRHKYDTLEAGSGLGQQDRDIHSTFKMDMTAEDMFAMFFGENIYVSRRGGNIWRQHHQRRAHQTNQQGTQGNPQTYPQDNQRNQRERIRRKYLGVLQALPFVFIGFILLMSAMTTENVYSLKQTLVYSVQRKTTLLKVPYFVKDTFKDDHKGPMKRLETAVEDAYVGQLQHKCNEERDNQELQIRRGRAEVHQVGAQKSCARLFHIQQYHSRYANLRINNL